MRISDWSSDVCSSDLKWDWEAGDVRGRLNVAAFYGKYKGALQFFNVVGTGIPNTAPDFPTRQSIGVNAADMTIQGVEVEAVVIPIAGLSFSFNGAYTDTNIDKVTVPPIGGLTLTKTEKHRVGKECVSKCN